MRGYIFLPRLYSKYGKIIFWRINYLLFLLFNLSFWSQLNAQRSEIELLKKDLLFLHDSAQVDCLNTLSLAYTYLDADTAKSYAAKAYNKASAINYLRGKAMSLNNDAHIAGVGFHDFPLQEKISLQTIQLYKDLPDENILSE